MCGIGGCVVTPGTAPPRDRLLALRDSLLHRGPDGSGVEVNDNVGLVHTRLAIVDLTERAAQPFHHPLESHVLTYNGEVYNHAEVRRLLDQTAFESTSDTETVLYALTERGLPALKLFNGQFAFALHDRQIGSVTLARDLFGIKPLYLVRDGSGIWFASEPMALVAAGACASPMPSLWDQINDGSYFGGQDTIIEGLHRVLPGSVCTISTDTLAVTNQVWARPADRVDSQEHPPSPRHGRRHLVDRMDAVLRSAVHDSMLADAPVGTLCSGGVDSSLITAMAAEHRSDLIAFGTHYKGIPSLDEGPAAQRACDHLGVELHLHEVTPDSWRAGFVSATLHFGGPIANASSVPIAHMAKQARDRGIKVLLTGEGADELLGGYAGLHATQIRSFLGPRCRLTRALEPAIFGDRRAMAATCFDRLRTRASDRSPMTPIWSTLTASAIDDEGADAIRCAYAHHAGARSTLEARLLESMDYTLCHLLMRMDGNMMGASVETRVPFLDSRVVEVALNLPMEARLGPFSKGVLRDVARRYLPLSIAHRPKVYGMDFDAGRWIEAVANPRFLSHGLLISQSGLSSSAFATAVADARGALRARIWSAEVWLRATADGQAAEAIEQDLWSR